jgi:hypothetical protein
MMRFFVTTPRDAREVQGTSYLDAES